MESPATASCLAQVKPGNFDSTKIGLLIEWSHLISPDRIRVEYFLLVRHQDFLPFVTEKQR